MSLLAALGAAARGLDGCDNHSQGKCSFGSEEASLPYALGYSDTHIHSGRAVRQQRQRPTTLKCVMRYAKYFKEIEMRSPSQIYIPSRRRQRRRRRRRRRWQRGKYTTSVARNGTWLEGMLKGGVASFTAFDVNVATCSFLTGMSNGRTFRTI